MSSPNDDAIEKMLNEIADLFKMVDEGKNKPLEELITPEVQAQLDKAKELVEKFSELNKQVFDSAGMKQEELNRTIQNPPAQVTPKQKKILEFSKKLKNEIEVAKEQLTAGPRETKEAFKQKKQTKEEIKKRKKKFKKLGGNDWLPL